MAVRTKPIEHVCYRDKEITDMHRILTGNGDPEKGLCRQVALLSLTQEVIAGKIEEIKVSLSNAADIEKEMEIQKRVKNEVDGIQNIKFSKKTAVTGLLLYALMLAATIFFSVTSARHSTQTKTIVTDTKSEIDMLNTPVTDPRSGRTYLMPAGLLIDSLRAVDNEKRR